MRKIVLIIPFAFVYQCLFSLISLLSIATIEGYGISSGSKLERLFTSIKMGYGTEMFAYAFYTNLIYFGVGFFFNILLVILLHNYKNIFYILFSLGVLMVFNIFIYIISDSSDRVIFSFGLFRVNGGWYINLVYHLSIVLSTIIMYFLFRKKSNIL
jgi:hypothetical protein